MTEKLTSENFAKHVFESVEKSDPDLYACMVAKVPLDFDYVVNKDGKGATFKIKTKYPCSVIRDDDGNVLEVAVLKNGKVVK